MRTPGCQICIRVNLRSIKTAIHTAIRTAVLMQLLAGMAGLAGAHPVSLSHALVFVTPTHALVKVDIFLEDLFLFHNLQPNDADYLDAQTIAEGIQLHQAFVAQRFMIQDVEGRILRPRAVPVVRAEIPEKGVPLADLMKHRLSFEMRYEFESPPEFLTFQQRFMNKGMVVPSEMQLQVRQEDAPAMFIQTLLPEVPHTVRFSWTDPPLSADASEDEWTRWVERQQEETLGISSYSSVYSFLYIEDYEVRHEILIPLVTLEQSLRLPRNADEYLDVSEQEAARPVIHEFFATGNPLEVDGVRRQPQVERCDFFGLDFKDFARQSDARKVPLSSARVGIILVYPLTVSPTQIKLTWDRFSTSLWAVNMAVIAFDQVDRVTLARIGGNHIFRWQAPPRPTAARPEPVTAQLAPVPTLELPLASIIMLLASPLVWITLFWMTTSTRWTRSVVAVWLAVAALAIPLGRVTVPAGRAPELSSKAADKIFAQVHANTYSAFRYRTEDEIYDALKVSADRELLRDIYLQIQSSLKMQEQGGAVSRIRHVEILEGEHHPIDSDPGFHYRCRWNVSGTVEHWGHVHERKNQYEARFRVEPINHCWKLTNLELLDERRLEFETRLR